MKNLYNKFIKNRLYLLLMFVWLSMSTTSCSTVYHSPDGGSFTGTTSYCEGATATANDFNYTQCTAGSGGSSVGASVTAQWYYNTTGSTVPASSTALGSSSSFTSSSSGAGGTVSYTPLTTTAGTFYYFADMTWSGGDYCTVGYITPAQTVTITSGSPPTATDTTLCIGGTTTVTDSTLGGTWSSSSTSVATVNSSGIVTALSAGTASIHYTSGSCSASVPITVEPVPPGPVVTPAALTLCNDSTLALVTTGAAWSPATYLYTDSLHTTPYTLGTVLDTIYMYASVSATTTQTYTVSATSSLGCSSDTTAAVTISDPAASISGTDSICSGGTAIITFTGSSGATVYYNINGGITRTSVIGSVGTATVSTGVLYSSATYSLISVVSGSCTAPLSDSAVITVAPPVHTISGDTLICPGSTVVSDTPTGGTWSTGGTSVATIGGTDGIIISLSSGTEAITYTMPASGCIATTTLTVYAAPAAITGGPDVCAGSDLSLSDLSTGGTWSTADTSIATIDSVSGIVLGVSAGTALITYTTEPGSCTYTYSVTVNGLPTGITGVDSVCVGLTTALGSTPTGGSWTSSSLPVATVSTSGVVSGLSSGTAEITYTLPTGCRTDTLVTVNPSPSPITGGAPLCAGSSESLSDTPATGGSWSTSTPSFATIDSLSGVLTGAAAGSAAVTYTLPPGGCTATATITINPLPSAITGADSVCIGLTTALGSTPSGGVWSSSSPDTAAVDPSGTVTGIAAGMATITYTLPTGCEVTYPVTVNTLPGAVSGPSAVCAGLMITFTDDTTGGSWSVTPAGTATIDPYSGILTGGSAGTATVTYTVPTGCIATAAVTVNPLPAPIAGADTVCLGLTTTLTDATGTGSWSSSDTTIATIDGSGNVSGVAVGTATITYTLGTGCIETIPMTVNPLPLPVTGPAEVCVNASIIMNDITLSGTWSTVPASVATINPVTGTLTGVSAGTVTVVYTLPTSCLSTGTVTVDPIPDSIGGTRAVCEDSGMTALTETTFPGTWSITPGSEVIIDSLTGVVTGLSAGPALVTYTLPVTGCFIAEPFTVNPLPAPVTGTQTVCAASTITLHDGTFGGTWSSAPVTIATISATGGVLGGESAGIATVTYTLGTGCEVTYTVTVDAQPAAVITPIGDTMICPGGFADLTANTGDSLTYQWYTSGAISGATASSYIATRAGDYRVKVTNGLGCSLTSAGMEVTVNPVATPEITSSGGASTCSGTGLTLSTAAGAGLSYQWQQDSVSITGAVSNTYNVTDSSGNYDVVVSNSAGCSATSNVIGVTVYPTPAGMVTTSGATTFCSGGSVTFTADTGTGYSYQWYGAGGAIPGATGISYAATTTDNYYVEETNTYGCTGTSTPVTVIAETLPNAAVTATVSTTFCTGDSVVLQASAVPGDSYQWYDNGAAVAGATNASYTDTVTGNFKVLVTAPTGCSDSTASATAVTVVTAPAVLPLTPTSFCWGGGVTLTVDVVSATGGLTYQWLYDGTRVSGATSTTYNTSMPGSYSCLITTGTCTIGTTVIPVTEYPLPDPLITLSGSELQTQGYYVSYQWYKNTVAISGATDSVTTATGDGDYEVAVTDTDGCQSVSEQFVVSALGVNTVKGADIKIYPNPAQTMLHIASPVSVRAAISSIDGRMLLAQPSATDIDISGLADGVYMIMLYDDSGLMVKTEKLVKTSN